MRRKEAASSSFDCFNIDEKALGPDDPDVAWNLENYAALLRKTGRNNEAVKLEARAKAIRAKYE
jgi:hypothetical protein